MSERVSADVKPYLLPEAHRHIASRFSNGLDDALIREVRAAGSGLAWFERQLDYTSIDDTAADAVQNWFPFITDDASTAWSRVRAQQMTGWGYGLNFIEYWAGHAILTRRHVHEQVSSFWSNLLYIPAHEDRSFAWRFSYDQTVRKYALTSYRQLLRACVTHPAMTAFLTNNENTADGINENLGRELLELHSVGRAGGYTEAHVKDSARLLTGFRLKKNDAIVAWYDPSKHWRGPVQVMGFRHANAAPDGRAALNAYLDYLALHPATAQRIAYRMCQRFVSDYPPPAIVKAVAAAYLASKSDIPTTLRALVKHPQFTVTRRARLRMPLDDIIATTRILGIKPVKSTKPDTALTRHTVFMALEAGQAPFRWPRPDGYPETSDSFASPARMIRSWELHQALCGNWWKSTGAQKPKKATCLPTQWPRRVDEIVEHQSRMLLGRPIDPIALQTICTILYLRPSDIIRSASAMSDWHFEAIRSIILTLPEGMQR